MRLSEGGELRGRDFEKERLHHVRIDKINFQGEDEKIFERSRRFREEVEGLINYPSLHKVQQKQKSGFLKAIAVKCHKFNNCYEPFEVIGEAYCIGQRKILRGEEIPSTEAWMRVTIWNLLCNKSRSDNNRIKKNVSFESNSISLYHGEALSLAEKIPAPVDLNNPYYSSELEDEIRINYERRERLKVAIESLTDREKHILDLREIKGFSWERVAQEIQFKGQLSALRKQGSRAIKKLKENYEQLSNMTLN
jgi:RNA polymerase sigma factor (sigma-70 family)